MIRSNNEIELAREFAGENEIEWTKDKHVEIVATMLMIKKGDKLFQLAPGYLQKFIQDDLNKKKAEDNYKQEIVEAILLNNSITQDKLDKAKAKIGRRTTNNKEIKSLTAANQELRTLNEQYEKEQEKMKKEIARMKALTRDKCTNLRILQNANDKLTEELWSNTKELFYLIKGQLKDEPTKPAGLHKVYKDSWNQRELLAHNRKLLKPVYDKGIAAWRAQDRKKYEPPPDAKVEPTTTEAQVERPTLPTTTEETTTDVVQPTPAVRQQNRRVSHSCGKCDGCSDRTRAECARDNNLDVWVQVAVRPKKRQKVYHESGNEDDGQGY
jgi:multidrug efflux pump subunit AcrA (membrane-fusion protein)